ncbi:MAG: PQQ-dependent sugar dehydrogenase [Actinomycetota bacterium]
MAVISLLVLAGCNEVAGPSGSQDPADDGTFGEAPAGRSPADGSAAQEVAGPPRLQKIGSFDQPTHLASPPGDERLFVVEKQGRVVIVEDGQAREPAFLDIVERVSSGGERGLFAIAFAPDYPESGLAYVSYTDPGGDSKVDEYRVSSDPGRLDPDSRRQILSVEQPFPNHNGGLIAFDPSGMLILGLGDGGSGGDPQNRAQDLGTLLGKFVRVDPRSPSGNRPYAIPADNPFVNRAGVRPEIWGYGLRNPWRWSFDPQTKDLYVGDVGQNTVEEVNHVPPAGQAGANYGWPRFEGRRDFRNVRIDESRLVTPVLDYPTSGGNCSVTGGGVYRGSVAQLKGIYLYGDFCAGVIKGFRLENGRAVDQRSFDLEVPNLASFGEDSAGEMYAVSLRGDVFKIVGG